MDDFKLLDAQRLFEREPDGLVGLRVDHLGHVHVADNLFCAELQGDGEEGVWSARSNNTLQRAGSVAIIDKVDLPEEAAIARVEGPVTVNVVDLGRRVDACRGTHTPLNLLQPFQTSVMSARNCLFLNIIIINIININIIIIIILISLRILIQRVCTGSKYRRMTLFQLLG